MPQPELLSTTGTPLLEDELLLEEELLLELLLDDEKLLLEELLLDDELEEELLELEPVDISPPQPARDADNSNAKIDWQNREPM